jgi:polyphenol oxidase
MSTIARKSGSLLGGKTRKQRDHSVRSEWKLRHARGLEVLESTPLSKLNWLVHGFSTRPGGASELEITRDGRVTIEKVLNLGFVDWDVPGRVEENRREFFHAMGAANKRVVRLQQIHSDIVHRIDGAESSSVGTVPRGDALLTRTRHVVLVIETADCVPILLADTCHRAIAAIHAGWRGTLRRIAEKTLGRMRMEFGTRPGDIIAVLGPSIARCCYEVGPEMAKEFHSQFADARPWFDGPFEALASSENDPNWLPWLTMMPPGHQPPPPRVHLDLAAANRATLEHAGVARGSIFSSHYCTACRTDLFFSYRREHTTGRLLSAIGIV